MVVLGGCRMTRENAPGGWSRGNPLEDVGYKRTLLPLRTRQSGKVADFPLLLFSDQFILPGYKRSFHWFAVKFSPFFFHPLKTRIHLF